MRQCVCEVELILLLPDWVVMMMDCLYVAENGIDHAIELALEYLQWYSM